MLVSGIVAAAALGGTLIALLAAGALLVYCDKQFDRRRRHWSPAESSTHW